MKGCGTKKDRNLHLQILVRRQAWPDGENAEVKENIKRFVCFRVDIRGEMGDLKRVQEHSVNKAGQR